MNSKRIGIYAGTFDPVHAGHVTFALQAVKQANLDKVYFLPERRPRYKQGVEHFAHRLAMLKRAVQPHPQFGVLEFDDISFTVRRTLPRLQQKFMPAKLVFLLGSDTLLRLPDWQHSERLLSSSELVVGLRQGDTRSDLEQALITWPLQPKALIAFDSYAPTISSGLVRRALYERKPAPGLLESVKRYSDRHWLYVSLA